MKNRESIIRARSLRRKSTDAEKILWERLRNRSLDGYKFLRQFPIQASFMNRIEFYIADFCCWEKKLIIELDGEVHNQNHEYDELRDEILSKYHYTVIRFSNSDIINKLDEVLNQIKSKL